MDSFRNIRDDGIQKVSNTAERLTLVPSDGDIVEQLDNHALYVYDGTTNSWLLVSQPTITTVVTSVFGRSGDVIAQAGDYTKAQVGLGNADNTSDLNKPISTATQTALNLKEDVINKVTTLASPNNTTYPTTLAVSNSIGVIDNLFTVMKEPTGFPNRTDSTISFDDFTRTLFVSPVGASFDFYIKGIKFSKFVAVGRQIPNTTGIHYLYFDNTGTLVTTMVFSTNIFTEGAFVAVVYWDASASGADRIVTFGEERHGLTMDSATHAYLHTTHGAAFANGCGLTNFTINAGNNNADAQFTSLSGLIWDEDINHVIPSQTQFPILYRLNGTWKKKTADAFPLIYNGTAGYTGTRPAYNLNTAGVWSLAEVPNTHFFLIHMFATNDVNYPVIGILGENQYNTKPSAEDAAKTEIRTISGLPVTEFCPIGSVIFQTNTAYSNIPKARVVLTDTGANYVDFRLENIRPGALA
jgi:hypothetical protein